MEMENSPFIKRLRDEVSGGHIAVVVGAGVSLQASNAYQLASWRGLLEDGIRRCRAVCQDIDDAWRDRRLADLNSARDTDDLLAVGTQVERKLKRQAGQYARWLADAFGNLRPSRGELLSLIGQLSRIILTTNYDTLLEEETNRRGVTWTDPNAVLRVLRGEDNSVVHLHGLWSEPESVVLGDPSYSSILADFRAQGHQHIFAATRTLLFVGYGFGMSDPNFGALLRWMGAFFSDANVVHYQLVREQELDEAKRQLPIDSHVQALSYGREHSDLPGFLRSLLPESLTLPAEAVSAPPDHLVTVIPEPPPLPKLDPQGPYVRSFIGREIVLGAFDDALSGLLEYWRGHSVSSRAGHVRLLWVHGFGGMGKSWFLRRACTRAEDHGAKIAFIDWDDIEWRSPLPDRPLLPEHIFECIGTRLTQLYGGEMLLPYWQARAAVRQAAAQHTSLNFEFSNWLRLLAQYGVEWRTSDQAQRLDIEGNTKALKQIFLLEEFLRIRNLLDLDASTRKRKLDEISQRPAQRRHLFEAWAAQAAGADASPELISPTKVMADALRVCVRQVCHNSPLLLVLDTCEVLSDELSGWLRHVLAPVLADNEPLLLVVGSRIWLDADLEHGSRDGWRNRVPQERIRQEAFDETVALTVDEIQKLLNLSCPSDLATYDAAVYLHRLTRGVPLALRVAMETIEGDLSRLNEIVVDDTLYESLDGEDELTQRVIETMSGRFLLHLENRPGAEEDFRDVMAIGILRYPSSDLLRQYWAIENASLRIRELSRRYSLFSGGDLHETIRYYVRRTWRSSPPNGLREVARNLYEAFNAAPAAMEENMDVSRRLLEEANLLTWTTIPTPWSDLACIGIRLLALQRLSYGYEDEFTSLLRELHPETSRDRDLRDKLADAYRSVDLGRGQVQALRTLSRLAAQALTEKDQGYVAMLLGLGYAQDEKYRDAVVQFEIMAEKLERAVPNVAVVSRSYLMSALQCMTNNSQRATLERALDWMPNHEDQDEIYPLLLGAAQRLVGRLDEAERTLTRARDLDQYDDGAVHQLAHVYELQGQLDEADTAFAEAVERNGHELHNWLCWGKFWEDRRDLTKAAEKYREATAVSPYSTQAWLKLSKVLRAVNADSQEAQEAVAKAMTVLSSSSTGENPDPDELNSVAWSLFELRTNLPMAEGLARRALKIEPDNLNTAHTLACLLLVQNKWTEARPLIARIIRSENPDAPVISQPSLLQIVADAVSIGGDAILTALQKPEWNRMRAAAQKRLSAGTDELTALTEDDQDEEVAQLAKEMERLALVHISMDSNSSGMS